MKKLYTAMLFLVALASNSQIVFEKGHFINNAGTRKECLIRNEDWRDNPVKFEYKESEGSESKTGMITDVREFGIGTISKYIRFTGKIEKSSIITNKLTKRKSPDFLEETLFLKTLIEGDANLYSYRSGTISKYFFSTRTLPVEQLVYIRYASENGDAAENNQFRQQLFNAVKCEKTSESDLRYLNYDENALVKYFEQFNHCGTGTATKFERAKTKKPFALRVFVGAAGTTVSTDGSIPHASIKNTVVKYGIEAEYILPFNKNTWSVFVAPHYYKIASEGVYFSPDLYGNPQPYSGKLDYKCFEIPFGVRHYFFLNASSKIFADVAYVLRAGESGSTLSFNKSIAPNLAYEDSYDIQSNNELSIGLGYSYRKFGIALKYNTGRDLLSKYTYANANLKSFSAIVSYRIF